MIRPLFQSESKRKDSNWFWEMIEEHSRGIDWIEKISPREFAEEFVCIKCGMPLKKIEFTMIRTVYSNYSVQTAVCSKCINK